MSLGMIMRDDPIHREYRLASLEELIEHAKAAELLSFDFIAKRVTRVEESSDEAETLVTDYVLIITNDEDCWVDPEEPN